MKTSKLTGALLDYWVAKAEGLDPIIEKHAIINPHTLRNMVCWLRGGGRTPDFDAGPYNPSGNLVQGGQIIEREKIGLKNIDDGLRAFVASKFGEEVEEIK